MGAGGSGRRKHAQLLGSVEVATHIFMHTLCGVVAAGLVLSGVTYPPDKQCLQTRPLTKQPLRKIYRAELSPRLFFEKTIVQNGES